MGKKKFNMFDSRIINNRLKMKYYRQLTEIYVSTMEWKNMPDTVDVRFLEMVLFREGAAVFFRDEDLGYLALRMVEAGQYNLYDNPTVRYGYGTNYYRSERLTPENSVIIWNTYMRTPSFQDAELYACRLYEYDKIMDMNIRAQKTPILIACDETELLSMKNVYMQYEGDYPVIFGTKGLNPKSLTALKTDAPFNADKIYQLKTQLWNEALTSAGISNINTNKKERFVVDEVTRNLGGTYANRKSRLNPRQQACKEINRLFGLNISCEFIDIDSELIEKDFYQESEGDEGGEEE